MKKLKVIVYHVGARDKYSVAEYFASCGMLTAFFTDFWFKKVFFLPKKIQKIAARRFSTILKYEKVYSYSIFDIIKSRIIDRKAKSPESLWISHDSYFTKFVIRKLDKFSPDIVYGFTNANLEILEFYKHNKNIVKFHNQIDPGLLYYDLKKQLQKSHSAYEDMNGEVSTEFKNRINREWELADCIIVNSSYTAAALAKYGVDSNKIEIVPLIFRQNLIANPVDKNYENKLNVAFIGNISVIKGFVKFIKVAEALSLKMNFLAVGTFLLKDEIKVKTENFINYTGHLAPSEMVEIYNKVDVLIFPTYCDGFGMVQLEAMANGIPVLATTNCGEVVIDSFNGYQIDSTDSIKNKLIFLDNNRNILRQLSVNSLETVAEFSQEKIHQKFDHILQKYVQ